MINIYLHYDGIRVKVSLYINAVILNTEEKNNPQRSTQIIIKKKNKTLKQHVLWLSLPKT